LLITYKDNTYIDERQLKVHPSISQPKYVEAGMGIIIIPRRESLYLTREERSVKLPLKSMARFQSLPVQWRHDRWHGASGPGRQKAGATVSS
jgi:hypothetical protein